MHECDRRSRCVMPRAFSWANAGRWNGQEMLHLAFQVRIEQLNRRWLSTRMIELSTAGSTQRHFEATGAGVIRQVVSSCHWPGFDQPAFSGEVRRQRSITYTRSTALIRQRVRGRRAVRGSRRRPSPGVFTVGHRCTVSISTGVCRKRAGRAAPRRAANVVPGIADARDLIQVPHCWLRRHAHPTDIRRR